jgi:hypothetical protein
MEAFSDFEIVVSSTTTRVVDEGDVMVQSVAEPEDLWRSKHSHE